MYWSWVLREHQAPGCQLCPSPKSLELLAGLEFQPHTHTGANWEKDTPVSFGRNTQIFCVFRTTILFLCLIKLHSEHSIIKTRPGFMHKWRLDYTGQRKDKLYAWKISLSRDSYKPTCWQGWIFFSFFSAPHNWARSIIYRFNRFIPKEKGHIMQIGPLSALNF